MIRLPVIAFIVVAAISFGNAGGTAEVNDNPDFLKRIENSYDFIQLEAETPYGSQFRVEWVKFLHLLQGGDVYFQQSQTYKLHHDFASKHLEPFIGMDEMTFKDRTQRKTNRLAFVGSLLRFPKGEEYSWGIQIVSQDILELQEIKKVFESVLEAAPFIRKENSEIYLIPTNEQKSDFESKKAELLAIGIPVRHFESFFLATSFQCYSEGWAAGGITRSTSKTVEDEFKKGIIKEDHTVVIDEVLAEMPPVSGLISETISVPSSHTALLFEQEKKPFLYLGDKKELAALLGEIGKPFFFETSMRCGGCRYRVAGPKNGLTPDWVSHLQDLRSVKVSKLPEKDLVSRKIKQAGTFGRNDTKTFGAKAANFSEMTTILGSETLAPGAGIPFYYFEKFLDLRPNGKSLRELVADIVSQHTPPRDLETLERDLKNLRYTMIQIELPASFLQEIQNQIAKTYPDPAQMLFLRSSTNAEDGEEFNGAGLYDSKAGRFADETGGKKPFSVALKTVWASLYKLNVFLAFHRFGIPFEKVAMGVLVNPYFNPLEANGVGVVKQSGTVQITSQTGAEEVTNPNPGIRPEIVDISPVAQGGYALSFRQYSSLLPAGWPVLKDSQYQMLSQWMANVRKAYDKYTDLELDFEWIKAGGKLYLTQVRPIPDMLRKSKMKDLPLLVFGSSSYHLKTCYGEGASAFRALRSKLTLSGDLAVRYFDNKLEKNDYWTDVNIQLGGRTEDSFSYPVLKNIAGLKSAFTLDGEQQVQDNETKKWLYRRTESLNTSFSVGLSPKITVQERRTSERVKETGLLIEPFAFIDTPHSRSIFESGFFVELDHGVPPPGMPEGEGRSQGGSIDNFYLCMYSREEGLLADSNLIPSQSEFLSDTYRITTKHLTNDIRKEPYLKTYDVVPQEVTFEGIITEPFTLKSWWSMAFTAHHHNFHEEFLFQPEKDDTLDPNILDKLKQKNIRWIHLYVGKPSESSSRIYKLAVIDPLGRRTELGALKSKDFPLPPRVGNYRGLLSYPHP